MATSERSLANLRPPWKPGESGNANGRKKGLVTLLREVLEQTELQGVKTPDGRSVAEHLAEAIIAHAIKGNAAYMVQVLDRLEGKAGSDVTSTSRGPILVEFEVGDDGRNPDLVIIELPKKERQPPDGSEADDGKTA
jgi:hypothetical protein